MIFVSGMAATSLAVAWGSPSSAPGTRPAPACRHLPAAGGVVVEAGRPVATGGTVAVSGSPKVVVFVEQLILDVAWPGIGVGACPFVEAAAICRHLVVGERRPIMVTEPPPQGAR